MDWQGLSRSNKILLMIIPSLLLIVLFISFYLLPNIDTIVRLNNENKMLTEEIKKANAVAMRYDELKLLNEKLYNRMEYLKALLPKETEVSYILKKVSEIGFQKGLVVTFWKPKEKTLHQSNEIYEIPVDVGMRGKYHTFGIFFADITKIDRIVNIKKMNFKKCDKNPTMLTANITAVTYSIVPEEEKKKIKQETKK